MFYRSIIYFTIFLTVKAIDWEKYVPAELKQCMPSLSMIDASGKLPSGLSSINLVDLGNFDQCLSINIERNNSTVFGKYCIMKVSPPKPNTTRPRFIRFHPKIQKIHQLDIQEKIILNSEKNNLTGLIVGWCIPHTCNITMIANFLTMISNDLGTNWVIQPIMDGMCQTKDNLHNVYNKNNIALITFLLVILFIIIISTIYDIHIQQNNEEPAHILLIAFSVKTNGKRLLQVSNNPAQLPCLHGIRVLSMMWVVYGHRVATALMEPNTNLIEIKAMIDNPGNMYLMNAPLSVDSFFVLSGFLVAYSFCLAMEKGMKFNLLVFYLHRYFRLTPVLAVIIWVHATIVEYFGSGPFWPLAMIALKDPCVNSWWATLIYLQNYLPINKTCIGQTWYLSVDMQLYILSPLILLPLLKLPRRTLIISGILILGSIVSSFVVTYMSDLPSLTIVPRNNDEFMKLYYTATHTRYGPWLMGLILGYYIFKLKNKEISVQLNLNQVLIGWTACLALLLACLFSGHILIRTPDKLGNSFFNGLHRHGWALGLCWVIFACTQGYAGILNKFLSLPVFQILSRFTYTIYLVHLSAQFLMAAAVRTNTYFSQFQNVYNFWGDFVLSLVISICLCLAFESPVITIEKVLFSSNTSRKKQEIQSDESSSKKTEIE